MTAKEAYEISKKHKEYLVNQQIGMVNEEIKNACKAGEFNVCITFLYKEVKELYENQGYTVVVTSDGYNDADTEIGWEDPA